MRGKSFLSRLFQKRKDNIFLNFLSSYLLVLIIPFIIWNLSIMQITTSLKKESIENSQVALEQTKDSIDNRLRELVKMGNQISLHRKIREFLTVKAPFHGTVYYDVWEIFDELLPFTVTDDFIASFAIYSKGNGTVLSPNAFYRVEEYYGTRLHYPSLSYDQWKNEMLDGRYSNVCYPAQQIVLDGRELSVLTFIETIPTDLLGTDYGNLTIYIEETKLERLFFGANSEDNAYSLIADSGGNLLLGKNYISEGVLPEEWDFSDGSGFTEMYFEGEEVLVSYTTSDVYDWTYIHVVPQSTVLSTVHSVQKLFYTLLFLGLAAGLLISFLLSLRRSKAMAEIVQLFSSIKEDTMEGERNYYVLLKSSINHLLDRNRYLQSSLEEQQQHAKEALFDRLLEGGYVQNMTAQLSYLEIENQPDQYLVFAVKILSEDLLISHTLLQMLDLIRFAVALLIEQQQQQVEVAHIKYINESEMAFVISLGDIATTNWRKALESFSQSLRDELMDKTGFQIITAVGRRCKNLNELNLSYEEALKALQYGIYSEDANRLLWADSIAKPETQFYFPLHLETKLINLITNGDQQGLEETLKLLAEENTEKRFLTEEMYLLLRHSLETTFYRGAEQLNLEYRIEVLVPEWTSARDTEESIEAFFKACLVMVEYVEQRKQKQEFEVIEQIQEYVKENYTDSQLTIGDIATCCDLSSTYLPHYYKSRTGETLFSFLENTRLEQSRVLLREGTLTIKTIAERVGYQSDRTFRRAFKRTYGVNPSEYQEAQETGE